MISKSEFLFWVKKEIFNDPRWVQYSKKMKTFRLLMRVMDLLVISALLVFLCLSFFPNFSFSNNSLIDFKMVYVIYVSIICAGISLYIYISKLDRISVPVLEKVSVFLGCTYYSKDNQSSLDLDEVKNSKIQIMSTDISVIPYVPFITFEKIPNFAIFNGSGDHKPRFLFFKIPLSCYYPQWIAFVENKWYKSYCAGTRIPIKNKYFKFYTQSNNYLENFPIKTIADNLSLFRKFKSSEMVGSFYKNNLYVWMGFYSFFRNGDFLTLDATKLDKIKEYERFYDKIDLIMDIAKKMSV